jgi:parallel beta-helix repeat protein
MKIKNRLEQDSMSGGKNIKKKIGALKRKTIPFLVVILVVTSALCYGQEKHPPVYIQGTVHNINTGEWFHWIQDAINDPDTNDNPGDHDIIEVYDPSTSYHPNGMYVENIVVKKSLTLRASDGAHPIIDGSESDYVVTIWKAPYVEVSGFTIQNGGVRGVHIWTEADHAIIKDNIIINNGNSGIFICSDYCLIENNRIISNEHGIRIGGSGTIGCIIRKNTIKDNTYDGMSFASISEFTISENCITNNNQRGIGLYGNSKKNEIKGNRIINSKYGIIIIDSTVTANVIYNNLFNNTQNAHDKGTNEWNIDKTDVDDGEDYNIIGGDWFGGNYWSDYTGEDDGSGTYPHDEIDGLGDTEVPYTCNGEIQNGGDYLPLVFENSDCPSCIVGYWKMDESSGTIVHDSINGNHGGVFTDGDGVDPVWVPGIVGNALDFAGDAPDAVVIGDDPAYHFGTGDFALEAWIKYEGPTDGSVKYPAILSKRPGPPGSDPIGGFCLCLSYWEGGTLGSLLMRIEDTNYVPYSLSGSLSLLDDGEWHHVVVQRCLNQVQFYVDGLLDATATSNKDATTNAGLTLGLDSSSSYDTEWEGLIDEVALYDCCLLPNTIAIHYEQGLNGFGYSTCTCLYSSSETMQMLEDPNQWDVSNPPVNGWTEINVIPDDDADNSAWGNIHPDLPWHAMYYEGAHWVYGNVPWYSPVSGGHEYYRIPLTVQGANCVTLHFKAYVDDTATFYITGPGYSTPTSFYTYPAEISMYEHDPREFTIDIDGQPGPDCLQPGDYTIYIDHQDIEEAQYGLIFTAECVSCPCCECEEWEDVTVTWTSPSGTQESWTGHCGEASGPVILSLGTPIEINTSITCGPSPPCRLGPSYEWEVTEVGPGPPFSASGTTLPISFIPIAAGWNTFKVELNASCDSPCTPCIIWMRVNPSEPCQWTSCGIINEVATNPANWSSNWTDTTITPETTITFQECNGDGYTLYGLPGLSANNETSATLQNYGECQYAKYCWREVNNKKIIEKWETLSSDDPDCQNCCEYCCKIDFTFIGSPVGGDGDGGSGPPCRCPGEILTYEYRLTNGGPYTVNCDFTNTSPVGNVTFVPSEFSVDPGGTQIIYIHYQMPGEYGDTCIQESYTFSHVLNVTVVTTQGDIECTPIEKSVHIDCCKCPEIGCCGSIPNLFSGEHMQMEDAAGNWAPINIIPWGTWDVPFGILDDQLHDNCGAEWIGDIVRQKSPSRSVVEHYKLDFTIPQGVCYEIAFSACVDNAAIFRLKAPNGVITEFFDTTEFSDSAGTYSNFYAYFEKGDNGEMEYCLPPGDYTLHIDHWNTEGPSYGLIFAATRCNPCSCPSGSCIDITKKVVDPTTGELVDNIEVPVGTEVHFKVTVCNCGTSDRENIRVVDEFPDCLEYLDSEASVTIDDIIISGNLVLWKFSSLTLHPGDCFDIKVKAKVVSEGDCENCVEVYVVSDEDCAAVTGARSGICLGSALLTGMLALGAIVLKRKKE